MVRFSSEPPRTDVNESAVMTAREVAEYLSCHEITVYKLAHQGKLPGLKLGGEWRFLKLDVDKWIAKGGDRQGAR
jgi:excisionase family DNA binding protein